MAGDPQGWVWFGPALQPSPYQPPGWHPAQTWPVNPLLDQRKPLSANPADWYHKLSDADVERIAKRVAELLRGDKP